MNNPTDDLRHAVQLALRYWPNDGSDDTPREIIRRAFCMIRNRLRAGQHIQSAIGSLEMDAYRHANM